MKIRYLVAAGLTALLSTAALPAWSAPRSPVPVAPFLLPPIPDIRDLIPLPRTGILIAPDVDSGMVFFDGYWWTQRDGGWYRSRDYRREFAPVPPGFVPAPLLRLRPDYREYYRHKRRIPYNEWKRKNWRPEWDQERRNEWGERREDRREDRHDRGRHEGRDRDRPDNRDRDRDRDGDRGRGRD